MYNYFDWNTHSVQCVCGMGFLIGKKYLKLNKSPQDCSLCEDKCLLIAHHLTRQTFGLNVELYLALSPTW